MGLSKDMVGSGTQSHRAYAINGTVLTGLTAAGSTQATALAIKASTSVFSTTAASTGAVLPVASIGDTATIFNGGASTLAVYPPLGGTINGGSANAAVTVATTKGTNLVCVSTNGLNWISVAGA